MARVEVKYTEDNVEKILFVKKPEWSDESKAKAYGAKAFKEALDNGAILKDELEKILISRGIWNEAKQKQLQDLSKTITDGLVALKKGGIKKSKARDIAIEIRVARATQVILMTERNKYEDLTVENQVTNAQFDALVALCTFDEEGNKIFSSIEDYRDKAGTPAALAAANELSRIRYGLDPKWQENLPENKFLKEHKFVNDNLELVDDKGRKVTKDFKTIDDDFDYVNDNNEKIDENGNKLDSDGLPVVESQPFLED